MALSAFADCPERRYFFDQRYSNPERWGSRRRAVAGGRRPLKAR